MITGLIASLALKSGLAPKMVGRLMAAAGVVLLIIALVVAWNVWLSNHDDEVIEDHEQGIEVQLQTQGRAADQNLTRRRDADLAEQTQERKEFDNATAHLPKSGLSPRQRVDACDELRTAGTDQAVLARAGCL